MNFVFLDIEFNNMQDINDYRKYKNNSLSNEIIEAGIIILDENLNEVSIHRFYVKHYVYSLLNPKITSITGITSEKIHKEGISINDFLSKINSFIGKDDIILTWGRQDIIETIKTSNYVSFSLDSITKYLDVQEYVSRLIKMESKISLKNALIHFGFCTDEFKFHNALNDCRYLVLIFKEVYNEKIFLDIDMDISNFG